MTLKAYVHLSDDTLLEYQHDLHTNSAFFKLKLDLDPATADASPIQQYLIVNGLCDEFMLEIDYDDSIVAAGTSDRERQQLLVAHAEDICNRKLSRELDLAERLLSADADAFFAGIAEKVDDLLDSDPSPAAIEDGAIPLTEKNSTIYLNWLALIESCIRDFVAGAQREDQAFSIEAPFALLDLQKIRTLGSLLGEIYDGDCAWLPYRIQTRKYHVGLVRVCGSPRLSAERIKFCVANCAASFFSTVARSPIGHPFEAASAELYNRYVKRSRELYDTIRRQRRREKADATRQTRARADLLVRELDPKQAERLQLAMEHEIDWLPIYYNTLTDYLRNEIETRLTRELSKLYGSEVDASRAVDYVDHDYLRHSKLSVMDSPDLLTLRASHIIAEFFDGHPWLSRLDISKPDISLVSLVPEEDGVDGIDSIRRLILLRDYLDPRTRAANSEMAIDIDGIAFAQDQQDNMIVLQQI